MSTPETPLRFNVSQAEYMQNFADMQKSYLPAVLEDTASNGILIREKLVALAKNGIVDGSFNGMRIAVSQLYREGKLTWAVRPGKKGTQPEKEPELTLTQRAWLDLKKQRDEVFLAGAITRVNNHHAHNYAKQAREQEALKAYLRELMKEYDAGKMAAETVEDKVVERINSYFAERF